MFYYKNKRLPHNLRIKMQSFCHFKINNFILKTKAAPKTIITEFLQKQSQINMASRI